MGNPSKASDLQTGLTPGTSSGAAAASKIFPVRRADEVDLILTTEGNTLGSVSMRIFASSKKTPGAFTGQPDADWYEVSRQITSTAGIVTLEPLVATFTPNGAAFTTGAVLSYSTQAFGVHMAVSVFADVNTSNLSFSVYPRQVGHR